MQHVHKERFELHLTTGLSEFQIWSSTTVYHSVRLRYKQNIFKFQYISYVCTCVFIITACVGAIPNNYRVVKKTMAVFVSCC